MTCISFSGVIHKNQIIVPISVLLHTNSLRDIEVKWFKVKSVLGKHDKIWFYGIDCIDLLNVEE